MRIHSLNRGLPLTGLEPCFVLPEYPHTLPHSGERSPVAFDQRLQGLCRGSPVFLHPRLRSVYGSRGCCCVCGSRARQNLPLTGRSRDRRVRTGFSPVLGSRATNRQWANLRHISRRAFFWFTGRCVATRRGRRVLTFLQDGFGMASVVAEEDFDDAPQDLRVFSFAGS